MTNKNSIQWVAILNYFHDDDDDFNDDNDVVPRNSSTCAHAPVRLKGLIKSLLLPSIDLDPFQATNYCLLLICSNKTKSAFLFYLKTTTTRSAYKVNLIFWAVAVGAKHNRTHTKKQINLFFLKVSKCFHLFIWPQNVPTFSHSLSS